MGKRENVLAYPFAQRSWIKKNIILESLFLKNLKWSQNSVGYSHNHIEQAPVFATLCKIKLQPCFRIVYRPFIACLLFWAMGWLILYHKD